MEDLKKENASLRAQLEKVKPRAHLEKVKNPNKIYYTYKYRWHLENA